MKKLINGLMALHHLDLIIKSRMLNNYNIYTGEGLNG